MKNLLPLGSFAIALIFMFLVMESGFGLEQGMKIPFVSFWIIAITTMSLVGLFDESISRYAVFAVMIQIGYFMLDIGTALLAGKSLWFAIVQFINFAVAGGLFAIIVTLIIEKKERMRDYAGIYDRNQYLGLALCIACLSLGGMPGFNIFVGEFIIYSTLFSIHPALTLGTVFASLAAFLFYFRICYLIFAGRSKRKIGIGRITGSVIAGLSALVLVMGLVPWILFRVLEVVA